VQLAQMASIAIENTLFAERARGQPHQGRISFHAQPRAAHARSMRCWDGRSFCGSKISVRKSPMAWT
jgi:hypothetical protein